METTNFTTSLLVNESPERVFAAIIDTARWWSGSFEGRTGALNDEFTYRYKDLHVSTQKIVEFVPGEKVVWLVTESMLAHATNKEEWLGTRIVFDISREDNKTKLRFTHVGLNPGISCFESCSTAWGRLIQSSLRKLITEGKSESLVLD